MSPLDTADAARVLDGRIREALRRHGIGRVTERHIAGLIPQHWDAWNRFCAMRSTSANA